MNARTSGSSVVVVIALVATSALGGSGGGSGNPRTPYRGAPTLEQVKAQRDETKTYWGDAFPICSRPSDKSSKVDLCLAKKGKCIGAPLRSLSGVNEQGQTVSVALADVKSVKFLDFADKGKESMRAKIEVVIFPDISPEELLRTSPGYSDLRSKTTVIQLALKQPDGSELAFGPLPDCEKDAPAEFEHFEIGLPIAARAERNLYWWAVPSVAESPGYPFRSVAKK